MKRLNHKMAYGIIKEIINGLKLDTEFDSLTIGTVIDTNDPQQMGRVRVYCPAWDSDNISLNDIPWAMYMTPFGGVTRSNNRGPDDSTTDGAVAYGAWHIPKVGANVIVMCIDKNPHYRIWMGCIYDQFMPHTMPHGRFLNDDQTGPVSSSEKPINPLSDNFNKAFNNSKDYEWKTRISDYSVASIDNTIVNEKRTESSMVDDKDGYSLSRIDPNITINQRKNYDSQVYCWVTPGFHSLSMDDRAENSRMRLRTASGHQILMDDSNERIYIMTAEGENWIEMDQKGNIDIFSNKRVSIRAKKDINLTSDETIRLHGKKGVHMSTQEGDIRLDAKQANIQIAADKNIVIKSLEKYSLTTKSFDLSASDYVTIGSESTLNIKGLFTYISGSILVGINGGGSVLISASAIHLNGPEAPIASKPIIQNSEPSFWTNRVPDHEPWPRVLIKNPYLNIDHTPEFEKNDINVNKVEEGATLNRNKNWKR